MKNDFIINSLCICFCIFLIISVVFYANSLNIVPSFNAAPISQLEKVPPDFIFIGNSVLQDSIDPNLLGTISQRDIFILSDRGSYPPLWFLFLKNYVSVANIKPKKIFIFFNDSMITDPLSRTSGKYLDQILSASNGEEVVYNKIVASARGNLMNQLFYRIFLSSRLNKTQEYFFEKMHSFGDLFIQEERVDDFKNNLNNRFAATQQKKQKIDVGIAEDTRKNSYDFFYWNGKSFLPPIIKIAKDNNLSLVFVRMKRRPDENGVTVENADAQKYVSDLRDYLSANGCEFYNLGEDTNIKQQWYRDSLHMADKQAFTNYFYQKFYYYFQ